MCDENIKNMLLHQQILFYKIIIISSSLVYAMQLEPIKLLAMYCRSSESH